MPRKPRKHPGRKKGYRKYIGPLRKGQRQYSTKDKNLDQHIEEGKRILHIEDDEHFDDDRMSELKFQQGFCGFDALSSRRTIRVLSLFDGISVGRHCLNELKIHVGVYFSSEIDEKALKLQKYNFGDQVYPLGCVKTITSDLLRSLGTIDLLLAAPPCQDFSSANPKRKNLAGENGQLFFEFLRILKELRAISNESNNPLYFICENVRSMQLSVRDEISKVVGVEPCVHNATSYGYMNRPRLFWGNIPGLSERSSLSKPVEKGLLQDVLSCGRKANVSILPTLTTTYHSQITGKGKYKKYPVTEDGQEESLLTVERERAFGLPASYTDGADLGIVDRRILLGRAWCANTVKDILKPLRELFQTYD